MALFFAPVANVVLSRGAAGGGGQGVGRQQRDPRARRRLRRRGARLGLRRTYGGYAQRAVVRRRDDRRRLIGAARRRPRRGRRVRDPDAAAAGGRGARAGARLATSAARGSCISRSAADERELPTSRSSAAPPSLRRRAGAAARRPRCRARRRRGERTTRAAPPARRGRRRPAARRRSRASPASSRRDGPRALGRAAAGRAEERRPAATSSVDAGPARSLPTAAGTARCGTSRTRVSLFHTDVQPCSRTCSSRPSAAPPPSRRSRMPKPGRSRSMRAHRRRRPHRRDRVGAVHRPGRPWHGPTRSRGATNRGPTSASQDYLAADALDVLRASRPDNGALQAALQMLIAGNSSSRTGRSPRAAVAPLDSCARRGSGAARPESRRPMSACRSSRTATAAADHTLAFSAYGRRLLGFPHPERPAPRRDRLRPSIAMCRPDPGGRPGPDRSSRRPRRPPGHRRVQLDVPADEAPLLVPEVPERVRRRRASSSEST